MVTLIVTRGYPASGKTTLARKYVEENDNWARVNRDDLRFNMYGKYSGLTRDQEDAVTIVQVAAVKALLNELINVVVDDTNLHPRSIRVWKNVWDETDCDFFEVINITTDVQECVARDNRRLREGERYVGHDVIYSFGERYPMPWSTV